MKSWYALEFATLEKITGKKTYITSIMKILSFFFVELHSKNRRDSVSIIDYLAEIQFCAFTVGGLLGFSFQKFYEP